MTSKRKTLLIDCGNTYLKWCLSNDESLTKQQSLKHKDISILEVYKDVIDSQSSICDSVVLVSVLGDIFSAGANKISTDAGLSFLEVQSQDVSPDISNAYEKPEKLGNDRWVAMIGADELINHSEACIVIDSGTATTIDAIDESGKHLGGVIFPGLELSLNSLSDNTELLPNLKTNNLLIDKNGFAKKTNQAIASGCLLGLAGAIDGICNKMQRQLIEKSPSLKVRRLLSGGGANTLLPYLESDSYLESDYDHYDNLIMIGLKKFKDTTSHND